MSIHSYVQSNITDYGTLTAILNENGVQWWPVKGLYYKGTNVPVHQAIQAVIGQETVLIWQQSHGEAFQFQSEGSSFRFKRQVKMIATAEPEAIRRRRAQQEQQRLLEEQRRREEAERQRRLEEERQRIEEDKRQHRLAEEASEVLARLDSSFRK